MATPQHLTEENYQASLKKVKKLALGIFLAGLIIGGILVIIGIVQKTNAERTNQERYETAYAESERRHAEAEARLGEIATELSALNTRITEKERACNSLDMQSPTWYADKVACNGEVSALRSQANDLEMEQFSLENASYAVYYDLAVSYHIILFIIAGGVVLSFSAVAGIVFLISKRRAIAAFTVQQTMPIAQEAIDKMAPTIGNAAGHISEGITRGIRNGKNN